MSASNFLEQVWLQNGLVALFFGSLFAALRVGFRTERWRSAWPRIQRDWVGMCSLVVVCIYVVVGTLDLIRVPAATGSRSLLDAVTAGVPEERGYSAPLAKTTLSVSDPKPLKGLHLLGTDALGRDTLIQAMKATKTAILIGGLTSAIYIPIGVFLGILAGYHRRWVDDGVQYVYSTVAAVPEILMLVAILMVLGKGVGTMAVALGTTGWVGMARLIRGETLRQSERPYVQAAKGLGQSDWKIILRHLVPNVMHLVVIRFVLGFSGLVLAESVLSYLGVGSSVGTPSWGTMIDGARPELSREPLVWWNLTAATLALFFLVLALNLLGDCLRRAFDPRRG